MNQKGCLYLVKLNKTSFGMNPGKVDLPKGRYIIEVRDGAFCYESGYTVDVEIAYNNDGKKKTVKAPDLGTFPDLESAINVYQGIAVEINHSGGIIDIYNHRPAMFYNGKCSGECVIAIWDGNYFGPSISKDKFIDIGYEPKSTNKILILTTKPDSRPYEDMLGNMELTWQSDLVGIKEYNAVIVPPESFSFLYMIRDTNAFDKYLEVGGRIYLTGAAPYYLNYNKNVPQNLPSYIGDAQYTSIIVNPGDIIKQNINDEHNILKFEQSITIPVMSLVEDEISIFQNINDILTPTWSVTRKFNSKNGKIVWSSSFLMSYGFTEKWNILINKQLEWLLL